MDKVLDELRSSIRARMNDVADALATGSATDFAEYKKLVGVIEGLAYAERDIMDLAEKYSE